ncbi:MAG: LysM peptidoglycan-binding domain-containing protein [Pseudomonadota bacterium]
MSKEAGVSGASSLGVAGGAAVITGAVAAVVGGFLYMAGVIGPQSDAGDADPATQAALEPASEPDTQTDTQTDTQIDTQTDIQATDDTASTANDDTASTATEDTAEATADAQSPTLHPSISTFRLEPDGQMLISGRSQPGWDVTILVDDAELSTFPSDASGEFAQFLSIDVSDAPRILRLSARSPETGEVLASLQDVIIAPMDLTVATVEPAADDTATQDETAAQDNTASATQEQADEVQNATSDTQTDTEADPATATSTAVLISDEDGVRVLQPPVSNDPAPEVMSVVALDTITYSEEGEVQLAGRGQSEGFVQVYLDNTPITTSRIEEDGNWRSDLPEVDTGVYTLRIDEVDDQGNVTSRVETPFKREDKDVLASQEETEGVRAITVQTGNTLWAISRERYGEGTAYVRIFEANRDRIRDPDMIFPGQVFSIPE